MSYTSASIPSFGEAMKHGQCASATPQTESAGQRALNSLASAITELDSRIDLLEKRINCAIVPQGPCNPCEVTDKVPRPSTSELVSTIDIQRVRIDGLIQRLVHITMNVDI